MFAKSYPRMRLRHSVLTLDVKQIKANARSKALKEALVFLNEVAGESHTTVIRKFKEHFGDEIFADEDQDEAT